MSDSFAHSLYHICSPTLRKVKPSNLFTLHKERCPNWRADLEECRATLERFGFGVAVLEDNRRYVVVMVYHIASLRRCLGQREPMRWLDALGCPAMGGEQLEEGEVEPFFTELEGKLQGRKLALFGSYGWGDGQWMRDWAERAQAAGAVLVGGEGLIANEAPDDDALDACQDLGQDLARL